MSALIELLRPLRPGEERWTKSTIIPNGTREIVTDRVCHDLIDELAERLRTSPFVKRVMYGPKILREKNTHDGQTELIVTAFAIVELSSPERELR